MATKGHEQQPDADQQKRSRKTTRFQGKATRVDIVRDWLQPGCRFVRTSARTVARRCKTRCSCASLKRVRMNIHLIPTRITLSLVMAVGAFLHIAEALPQARPLFTQHERQSQMAAHPNPACKPEPYETPIITYSEITVFDSREVVYRISTEVPCRGPQVGDPPLARRWEAPSGTAAVFRYRLSTLEFEQFKAFLERADVQSIHSFMNAGPGVGDFKVAIARSAGTQNIDVVSLSPDHFQLVNDPALIHVVCKAKEIGRMASSSGELPDWCRNVRPLNPAGGPK
jgi:hypothetical protein